MTKIGKEKASQVGASAAETAKKVNAEQHAVQGGLEGLSDDFVKRSEHKVVQTQFTPLLTVHGVSGSFGCGGE